MIKVASLHFDNIFKKAFGDAAVFQAFARAAFGVDFKFDRIHEDYRYRQRVAGVDLAYDLFAEDEDTRSIVEMHHRQTSEFKDRYLYYHLVGLVEQVPSHRDYRFKRTVYTIVILTDRRKSPGHDFAVATSTMNPVTDQGETLAFYPHRLVFMIPQNAAAQPPERSELTPWLRLIDDSLDERVDETAYSESALQRVIEQIRAENLTPEDHEAMRRTIAEEDLLKDDGRAEGRVEGRAEGRVEERRANVLALLRTLPPESVATAMGLDLSYVLGLHAEGHGISDSPGSRSAPPLDE
ncbi:Rpn family recombination-promoting nuclease/putative transposase [Planctomycetota bacterium]|nr:Rpn family recombination-promoting nuclease/putative transposase [Planctomycetota bacterium]